MRTRIKTERNDWIGNNHLPNGHFRDPMRRKRLRDNGAILSGISVRSKCDANWLQSSVEYIYSFNEMELHES